MNADKKYGEGDESWNGIHFGTARIFVGLDLGQSQDPSALSVWNGLMFFATKWIGRATNAGARGGWRVFLERLLLGTPYPRVVERVRQVVRRSAREGKCTLVVDATGLGAPVVDMLRIANLRCEFVPVLLTGGEGSPV